MASHAWCWFPVGSLVVLNSIHSMPKYGCGGQVVCEVALTMGRSQVQGQKMVRKDDAVMAALGCHCLAEHALEQGCHILARTLVTASPQRTSPVYAIDWPYDDVDQAGCLVIELRLVSGFLACHCSMAAASASWCCFLAVWGRLSRAQATNLASDALAVLQKNCCIGMLLTWIEHQGYQWFAWCTYAISFVGSVQYAMRIAMQHTGHHAWIL
jgi:hypothetical protein